MLLDEEQIGFHTVRMLMTYSQWALNLALSLTQETGALHLINTDPSLRDRDER